MTDKKPHLTPEDQINEIGRFGSFAGGAYISRCTRCKRTFAGDKRALSCFPCEFKSLTAERDRLRKALASLASAVDYAERNLFRMGPLCEQEIKVAQGSARAALAEGEGND